MAMESGPMFPAHRVLCRAQYRSPSSSANNLDARELHKFSKGLVQEASTDDELLKDVKASEFLCPHTTLKGAETQYHLPGTVGCGLQTADAILLQVL